VPERPAGSSLEPIAIIGMSCRLPGAPNVRVFWEHVAAGVESITQLTRDEVIGAGADAATVDKPNYVRAAGIVDAVEWFDAGFFRIPPGEAELMDPQQRLSLECAWEAFEDAGYAPGSIYAPVGVFVGASASTYLFHNIARRPDAIARFGGLRTLLANDKDHIATILAHQLNLTGPAVNVSSACSSSLVSIAFACQSLWTRQVDVALAGGAAIHVPQRRGYLHERDGIYSADGHCRPFDRTAAGTVGGSGVGLVVLKRASEAEADGDHVYATIRGAAVNNDGRDRVGYTAPAVNGQAAVIAEALATARVDPSTIAYIEAHGTGTPLGDAVEIAALTEAFANEGAQPRSCAVGSAKAIIGHLDAAAGVASLIKTALALEHQVVPPAINFVEPNPNLNLNDTPFYFPARALAWTRGEAPRRAGVSSFGMGGTNAHLVLEEAPPRMGSAAARGRQLVIVSARRPADLARAKSALARYFRGSPADRFADAAYTLAIGRHAEPLRACCICEDPLEAAEILERGGPALIESGQVPAGGDTSFVWCFSAAMPRDVAADAVGAAAFEECASIARSAAGIDIRRPSSDPGAARAHGFAVQYAIARTLCGWGLSPSAFAGAGSGELVADVLFNRLPTEAAIRRAIEGEWRADRMVNGEPPLVMETLARLWVAGAPVDWSAFYAGQNRLRVSLPTYPFQRERYWIDPPPSAGSQRSASPPTPALRVAGMMPALRARAAELDRELGIRPIEHYGELEARLNDLCASHAYWFLRAHGLTASATGMAFEAQTTRADLAARLRLIPEYDRLLDNLLDTLAADGYVTMESGGLRPGSRAEPPLPPVLAAEIRRRWPEFRGLVELLGRCVGAYPRICRDRTASLDVLYPNASGDLLRETLAAGTVEHLWTRAAARLVGDLIRLLAAGASRPLRILEVGAGGGGLTFEIAPALAGRASLHVTDVSPAFVGYLQAEAHRKGIDALKFGTLDIARDPIAQSYRRGTFDLIVGLDVLHAAPDVPNALRHLDALLAPDGVLAFAETVHADRWTTMIWGVSSGWWHFTDDVRARSPLLGASEWRDVLESVGPGSVHVIEEPAREGRTVRTALLVRERLDPQPAASPATPGSNELAPLPARHQDVDEWFSVPSWVRLPRVAAAAPDLGRGSWLIFADDLGVGARIADDVSKAGGRAVMVHSGATFSREDRATYRLRPGHAPDYLSLMAALRADDILPSQIVHCWSVAPVTNGNRLAESTGLQALGFDSLVGLMQAIGVHHDAPLTLTAVANGIFDVTGDEALSPVKSLIASVVKIAPREYPNVTARLLDIAPAADDETIDAVLHELTAPATEPLLAIRGAYRWRQTFSPIRLPAAAAPLPTAPGACLVVGGLGAVGLALAGVLAEQPGTRLVLVARTPFPPRSEWDALAEAADGSSGRTRDVARTITRIRALEASGAGVRIRSADVTDESQMRAVIEEIRARDGAVRGVIHAAGRPDLGGVMQRRTAESTRLALEAKVRGSLVLERVLEDEPLEFMVLCSSVGAILYNLKFGEVGYVAANDFLNAFAHDRARRQPGRVVAIDWTDWAESGMWAEARERLRTGYAGHAGDPSGDAGAHGDSAARAAIAGDLLQAMATAEGMDAFRRILRTRWPQVVVSTQPLQALLDRHASFTVTAHRAFLDAVRLEAPAHARPTISVAYVAPRTEIERRLCLVWQELLGIDRVGVDDDFFELGGDSLLAIRIVNRLREDFGVDRSLASLMEVPTVAALAAETDAGGPTAAIGSRAGDVEVSD
jgi:acyl transferase domain-containing protein/predicted O-methyltransferase YrrM/acyl carrier protein